MTSTLPPSVGPFAPPERPSPSARGHQLLHRHLPELAVALDEIPFAQLEADGSATLGIFKAAGGPGLVVPVDHGGLGLSAVDAVELQLALASRAPSLAVGSTMHHLSIATLVEHAVASGDRDEQELVRALVESSSLLASAFAEHTIGGSVFRPTMRVRDVGGELLVSGSKKPCSLARSMDILTASVADRDGRRAVIVVPAGLPGIEVRPYWGTSIFGGAESDEVVLDDVVVPPDLLFWHDEDDPDGVLEKIGYLWFGLLASASYLGLIARLLDELAAGGRAASPGAVEAASELELARRAVCSIAGDVDGGRRGDDVSTELLMVRLALPGVLQRASSAAAGALGGRAFIDGDLVAYVLAAVHAYPFHPPVRPAMVEAIGRYHQGEGLTLA